ncbi:MAG: DEAD/DEAH box helicase family protein, partial [Chloroflexi bacterium]|nr:DEAD/DEAH box helicase family protein [Chloroflexota bacterium]
MNLSEADTRAKLIDPKIRQVGWTEDLIRREESAPPVDIVGGKGLRRTGGRMDYVLRARVTMDTQPVALALLEAKRSRRLPGSGLSQAKDYLRACKRLNVRFVFSSNGYQYVEYDSFSGLTSGPFPMEQFPSPDALRARYEAGMGFTLDAEVARPLLQPYRGGEGVRRYYQDAAIRAVMEQIAQQQQCGDSRRALLSLATGAGKTFIAVNLLRRIYDAGQLRRALFLCDRDELRTQGLAAFQRVFGDDAGAVFREADGTNHAKNAKVHVATYQTLGVESDDGAASFLTEFYPPNYFSHVVIDECHRSAWGKWSLVLTRNAKAVQIGLTATPRILKAKEDSPEAREDEQITANNVAYFGEPAYEYTLSQAIEDGYLAACEIVKGRVDLDETGLSQDVVVQHSPVDAVTGTPVIRDKVDGHYGAHQFEDRILLPDRVAAMCQDLFAYLLETGGPHQKTIIFCVRDAHADAVANQMNNLYATWCRRQGVERAEMYAFKCTAASSGNDQLPDLRAASRSHFVATTVDLLTTGVDVPCVRNIVFFRYIKSPISFYQMVGRGTRIDAPSGKLMFRVYDYTNATRLFGEEFVSAAPAAGKGPAEEREGPPPPAPIVVDGLEVHVSDAGRFIVADVDGQAMPVPIDEYKERLARRLMEEAQDLPAFRARWVEPGARRAMLDALVASGCSPDALRVVEGREEYDLYDVLAEVGWGLSPRTRKDRALAFTYKQEDWIAALPAKTAKAVRAIAGQFEHGGTDALENQYL